MPGLTPSGTPMQSGQKLHLLVLPSWYDSPDVPLNGLFFREQALAVSDSGVRVGVIYPEARKLRTVSPRAILQSHFQTTSGCEDGISTLRYHGWSLGSARLRARQYLRQAVRLFRAYCGQHGVPDVVHAQGILWGAVAAHRIRSQWNIPYVVTAHSSAFTRNLIAEWQRAHVSSALNDADRIMAVGSKLAEHLVEFAPARQVEQMPNMVDTAFFTTPPSRRTGTPWPFLSVGFFVPKKGFDVLIKAFAMAFRDQKDVVLRIGGDGPERTNLEDLASRLGIGRRVEFLGMLSPADVRRALWGANSFVSSSHVETFGVVLIEAMSTGLPVIATRSGGPENYVQPAVGRLVSTGDVKSLGEAMRATYEASPDGPSIALQRSVRDYVVQDFDRAVVAERLIEVYRSAVGG